MKKRFFLYGIFIIVILAVVLIGRNHDYNYKSMIKSFNTDGVNTSWLNTDWLNTDWVNMDWLNTDWIDTSWFSTDLFNKDWADITWFKISSQPPKYKDLNIQYDYGFFDNSKLLQLLSTMKNSNPAQVQKYKTDLKQSIEQITKELKIESVDFVESGEITRVVIRHEKIDMLHKVLQAIREYGIVIRSIQIFKPTDKYNLDIKVKL